MLEKKIEALGEYFDGILRLPQDFNCVKVKFPEGWTAYDSKTDNYQIVTQLVNENNIRKMMFIGSPNATISNILDFSYQVIMNNLENENKKQLFQSKVKEMADIFDTNQLATLEFLTFKFEKPKKGKKGVEVESESIEIEPKDEVKTETKVKSKPIIPISDEKSKEYENIKRLANLKE